MKRFWKVLISVIAPIVILLLVILFQSVDPQQQRPNVAAFRFPEKLHPDSLSLDSLWQVVGDQKTVPRGFEKAALVAYSAYPQLREVSIEMILTESGAPMESNFDFWTLFGAREDRVYQVLLNDAEDSMFEPILLRNLPFDAQVGILAHELGHVVYYERLTTLQIAKWGIMYLISIDFRATHERTTDLMPVYHGLGHQIYEYAHYVRHDPTCKPMYEDFQWFMDTFYMTDEELKEAMEERLLY